MPFAHRRDAGRRLAARLASMALPDLVVLALPRGGVPVAYEVADALHAPLDVIIVRKLGVPFQPELAMGAIGEGEVRILNDRVVEMVGVSRDEIASVEARERAELARRASRFRGGRDRVDLTGRTALLVDDGIATGATARVACRVARHQGAARVIFAAPVAPPSAIEEVGEDADEVVVLETPAAFYAIGQFYDDFTQTDDDEVVELLARAHVGAPLPATADLDDDPPVRDDEVEIAADTVELAGHLTIPEDVRLIVAFAHGSGSSRHSPRNRHVAAILNRSGIGTLLFDLLTTREELDRANVFDVELLAGRLGAATRWLRTQGEARDVPIGYFGASTGAAAALWAAAEPGAEIAAVVSRGGRPDLASSRLALVASPTLLIVGGDDTVVLQLNREAHAQMLCEARVAVVPGATHLFEEPGTLDEAARLACEWFVEHVPRARATR
ncbi:MAG TPA: phosphoribosyltransferase [Acidimicrobiia bacterium]|nr:phosphoribosyltransferase [Acidimicrobiia bacterium]